MKQLIKYSAIAGLAANLFAGTPVLAADDGKIFPGSMCNWQSNAVNSEYRWSHVLRNTHGSNQWATCPMVRDHTGKSPEYASITVDGGVSGACYMEFRLRNGGGIRRVAHGNSVNLGNGKRRFEWFKGNADGPNHSSAAYAIECNLRPNASILRYALTENT